MFIAALKRHRAAWHVAHAPRRFSFLRCRKRCAYGIDTLAAAVVVAAAAAAIVIVIVIIVATSATDDHGHLNTGIP